MTEFEQVLDECLRDIERGASDVDQCLMRHPELAQRLKPILLVSGYLEHGREAQPSSMFKARVRAKLTQQMRAYPRKSIQINFSLMRLAASLAVIVLALLITGTAYAQSALPGEPFYAWKLASENAWRAISPDPVGTDIAIAERRLNELIAIGDDSALYPQALNLYLQVVARLRSEMNAENEARILAALVSQIQKLNQSGVIVPQFDDPILAPQLTPEIPQIVPTGDFPQLIPTLQVPSLTQEPDDPILTPLLNQEIPQIVPTNDFPQLIPTLQVPSLIP
jgi:hypothetical protein